jgi:DNA-binding GntR family transcriptional regulator
MSSQLASTQHDGSLGPQKRQMLADGVYETLMSFLMSGTLAPGDPVSIDVFARELEVSPTPVREALARIEATGLVVREPHRGYRVAPLISPEDFRDLTEARLLLEPYNTAAACNRRSNELLDELSNALAEMRAAPTGPTYREFRVFLAADARFHEIIGRYAGNHFLAEATARFEAHQHRFRLFGNAGVTDATLAIHEHEGVFNAIRRGAVDKAREAMRRHIENVFQRAIDDQRLSVSSDSILGLPLSRSEERGASEGV